MSSTGYDWGTIAHMSYAGPNDWDGVDIENEGAQTSLEVDLDGKAACRVSVILTHEASGTPSTSDGVRIHVFTSDQDPDSEGWQGADDATEWFRQIITGSATHKVNFSIDPKYIPKFKVYLQNEADVEIDTTVNYNTAVLTTS